MSSEQQPSTGKQDPIQVRVIDLELKSPVDAGLGNSGLGNKGPLVKTEAKEESSKVEKDPAGTREEVSEPERRPSASVASPPQSYAFRLRVFMTASSQPKKTESKADTKEASKDAAGQSKPKVDTNSEKKDEANDKKGEVNDKKGGANDGQGEANDKNDEANDKKDEANDKKDEANDKKDEANDKKDEANDKKDEANDKKYEANDKKGEASDKKGEANAEKGEGDKSEAQVGKGDVDAKIEDGAGKKVDDETSKKVQVEAEKAGEEGKVEVEDGKYVDPEKKTNAEKKPEANAEGKGQAKVESDESGSHAEQPKGSALGTSADPKLTAMTTVEFDSLTVDEFQRKTLADVRVLVAPAMTQPFRFSDISGCIVQDNRSLASYFRDLGVTISGPPDLMEVYVVKFARPKASAVELLDNPPFLLKFIQLLDNGRTRKEGTLHSTKLPAMRGGSITMKEIRKHVKAISAFPSRHQFCLDDGHAVDDSTTLKEYVGSLSKIVSDDGNFQATPSIEIYFSKPGIKEKESNPSTGSSIEFKPSDFLQRDLTFKGDDSLALERDKEFLTYSEKLQADKYRFTKDLTGATKSAAALTEDEWSDVIQNCSMMFGWIIDVKTGRLVPFKLRNGLNMGSPADAEGGTAVTALEGSTSQGVSSDAKPKAIPVKKAQAIPNFAINDNSRVDITLTSHQFQTSMAEAHFSAASVEGSLSGAYNGISAGVSGGNNDQTTTGKSSSEKQNNKTVYGTYRFPRATVYLNPSDLEPTKDLRDAIARIQTRKNIADLRRLNKEFGQFFCEKLVVGGCLQTNQVVDAKETASDESTKSQFKSMVGLAVQSPWLNVGYKKSKETGSNHENGQRDLTSSERLVFEATGGNTILASDPIRWTASLADHQHWRVIEQDKPSSLTQILAQMPGYSQVPMWFMQAVPALSRFVEIPVSRTLHVRMKVLLPANQSGLERVIGSSCLYLGHNSKKKSELTHHMLEITSTNVDPNLLLGYEEKGRLVLDMTTFTRQESVFPKTPLFYPESTQAPALISYSGGLSSKALLEPNINGLQINASLHANEPGKTSNTSVEPKKDDAKDTQAKPNEPVNGAGLADDARTGSDSDSKTDEPKEPTVAPSEVKAAPPAPQKVGPDGKPIEQPAVEGKKNAGIGKLNPVFKPLGTAANSHASDGLSAEARANAFKDDYQQTIWRLEVPDGEVLAHESRVTIKSLAFNPNPTLSVYRNQQGVYLPALSSHDGPSFWRILKSDPRSRPGDPIRDGDGIRLSWRFSDQTDGFRDFYDDTFGRRRFTRPEETPEGLYLKVPYPSFQHNPDIALVLSSADNTKPVVESLKVIPRMGHSSSESSVNYNLHDISFRLDSAGDDGLGEANDYMAPIGPDLSDSYNRRVLSPSAQFLSNLLMNGLSGPIAEQTLRSLLF